MQPCILTKIQDGILFIQWTIYSLEGTSLLIGTERAVSSEGADKAPSKVHATAGDGSDAPYVAEYELRQNGHLVFHDQFRCVLWVFDLSGPNFKHDLKDDGKTEPGLLLSRFGFKSGKPMPTDPI